MWDNKDNTHEMTRYAEKSKIIITITGNNETGGRNLSYLSRFKGLRILIET